MTLFLSHEIPTSIDEQTPSAAQLNELYDQISARKLKELKCPFEGYYPVHFHLLDYIQVNLWRMVDLLDSMVFLMRQKRGLPSLIVGRSFFETVSDFSFFSQRCCRIIDKTKRQDICETVHQFTKSEMFKTRKNSILTELGEQYRATNINTRLNKFAKIYPPAVTVYEGLCEYAHPNSPGTRTWYAKPDHNNFSCRYSLEPPDVYEDFVLFQCHQMAFLLTFVEMGILDIEKHIPLLTILEEESVFGIRT